MLHSRQMIVLGWVFCLLASTQAPAVDEVSELWLRDFDRHVEETMTAWGIPGAAIAIVEDGEIVHLRGYGVRTLGDPERVDGDTVFAIASITKSFTAAALGMLVSEGALDWDDRVIDHLPDLVLYDPYVTNHLTVRDLLAHRSCIESKNLLTWESPLDSDKIYRRLRYLGPECGFRSSFEYNNLGYFLAGKVLSEVSGMSWDRFVRERLLVPLGMKASTTNADQARKAGNIATPHMKIGGALEARPLFDEGAMGPAGSIHSSARDMARWLQLQLAGGSWQDREFWSDDVHHELHTPQIVIPGQGQYSLMFPVSEFLSYGLGWFVFSRHGERIVEHGGQSDGMHALVSMMPAHDLGIVVLSNTNLIGFPQAVTVSFYDRYLGASPRDWSGELMASLQPINDAVDWTMAIDHMPHTEGTRPSLELEAYTGTFHNDLLGELDVIADGDHLGVELLGRVGTTEHWHWDTFHIDWEGDLYLTLAVAFVNFEVDMFGVITAATLSSGDRFERIGE